MAKHKHCQKFKSMYKYMFDRLIEGSIKLQEVFSV